MLQCFEIICIINRWNQLFAIFTLLSEVVKMTDAGDGKLQKMEVDYSSTVDEKIPECEKLSKVTFIDEPI